MQWLRDIAVQDGLEEKNTERIVSYISGDEFIQLAGFFTAVEINDLAVYLKSEPLLLPIEPPPPDRQPE